MKRMICILLAIMVLLSLTVSASAVDTAGNADIGEAITATGTDEPVEAAGEAPTEAPVVVIPVITKAVPVKGGIRFSFTSFDGAAKYRLFYKNGESWKKIGDTTALSYDYTGAAAYEEKIYTVRAVGSNGKYCSSYDKNGFAYTYLPDPVLKSAACTFDGIKVSWNAMQGVGNFRVYLKNGSGWKGIGDTSSTSFVYKKAASGESCTFTVRVYDKDSKTPLSYYDKKGVTAKYIAAPTITGFTPTEGGVKVNLTKPSGAASVRLFYKNGDSWKKIGDTTASSVSHTGLADRAQFVYTVRAMDSSNKYISGYNTAGWTYGYIAPPELISVNKTAEGWNILWKAKNGVAGYRVYRKVFTGSWTEIGTSATNSFTDKTAKANTLYAYTVRCLDENNKAVSYYVKDVKYYYNGALADGKITHNGVSYNFANGSVRQGFVTAGGKTYYYNTAGELVKNGIVGSASEGYRYADKNGVIDDTARLAVSWGGYDWNVLDGRAYKVSTAKDRTLNLALKKVAQLTKTSMTKAQKLRACFDYLQTETYECNPRVPHYRGTDWPIIYANDIFNNGGGNCFSYAAAFGFMAKAIGYEDVYACSSGGHGWTEIGGLVYDSEWQRSHHTYSYYGLSYNSSTDVNYAGVRANFGSAAYMHVKI